MSGSSRQDREKKSRDRKRQQAKRQTTRQARAFSAAATAGTRTECLDWPVERVRVPLPDAWDATGLGSASILRRQPDGRLCGAFFFLDLMSDGFQFLFCLPDAATGDFEKLTEDHPDEVPR